MEWDSKATNTIEWWIQCRNTTVLELHLNIISLSTFRISWLTIIQIIFITKLLILNLVIHNSTINSLWMPLLTDQIKTIIQTEVLQDIHQHPQVIWGKEHLQQINSITKWWTSIIKWTTTKCLTYLKCNSSNRITTISNIEISLY